MWKTIKEIADYRELIKNLVWRDLKLKYKGSILGFFWSLLNPLLMLLIYTFAFDYVLKIRQISNITNFPLFFICAFLPWNFFAMALSMSVSSVVDNSNLVKKIYFPREILPTSVILSNLVNFILTFLILFPALLIFKVKIGIVVLLLPILILFHLFFTIGLGLFLSSMYVFLRDIKHLLEVALIMWFWLTPIVYPMELIPGSLKQLYLLNPMTVFIEIYRDLLLYAELPNLQAIIKAVLFTIISFLFGYSIFSIQKRKFAENI